MRKINLSILLLSLCLLLNVISIEVYAENHLSAPAPSEASREENLSEISEEIQSSEAESDEIDSEEAESDRAHRYGTKEGIQIVSYVETWPEDKLPEIAEELYRNRYGLEIEYLDRIEIYPGIEPNGNEQVSASYEMEQQQLDIPINLSGFLPADYQLEVPVEKGVIRIYKGEEKVEIEDIAMELSHEYGHHFTFFHFEDTFTPQEFKESTYYKVRQLYQYPQVNGEASYEEEIHRWSIFEIAAEDYHQLLGSPIGKRVTRYLDISQKMGNEVYQPMNTASRLNFNAIPQENWNIPLASQVEGLHQYFISFLEGESNVAAIAMTRAGRAQENLPSLSHSVEEHFGFKRHIIEWDGIEVEGSEQPVYTLVAINEDNWITPIKTVYSDEKTIAVVGTVTQEIDSYIYYYQDGLDQGSLDFRLYIQYPDGRVLATKDLTVEFE